MPLQQILGDIWQYHLQSNPSGGWVGITTNGSLSAKEECIMGRGIALQAKERFPDFPKQVGEHIKANGNVVGYFNDFKLFTFPTKVTWKRRSELDLIGKSACSLRFWALENQNTKIYIPRPACGNGGLTWNFVEPILESFWGDLTNIWVVDRQGINR